MVTARISSVKRNRARRGKPSPRPHMVAAYPFGGRSFVRSVVFATRANQRESAREEIRPIRALPATETVIKQAEMIADGLTRGRFRRSGMVSDSVSGRFFTGYSRFAPREPGSRAASSAGYFAEGECTGVAAKNAARKQKCPCSAEKPHSPLYLVTISFMLRVPKP